jgi:hypothetical protein
VNHQAQTHKEINKNEERSVGTSYKRLFMLLGGAFGQHFGFDSQAFGSLLGMGFWDVSESVAAFGHGEDYTSFGRDELNSSVFVPFLSRQKGD